MSNKSGSPRFIRWFDQLSNDDIALVGGKNASLGELYQQLVPQGVRVPNGFAITAQAYHYVLAQGGALQALHTALAELDPDDIGSLSACGARARAIIYDVGLPVDLQTEIIAATAQLRSQYSGELSFAVRSSATAEDLPEASFAGQHDSFLNLRSDEELIESCRRCFASLFTNRAIHYRVDHGFDHFSVALSIGVMKMVRSDLAASGVMFSIDTETGFPDVAFITGSYGLGETVVQGAVAPDEFYVHKPTYEQGYRTVLRRSLGSKRVKMIYASAQVKTQATETIDTELAEQKHFCINDAEVLQLADYCIKVEQHYSNKSLREGQTVAMDMEWAKDGIDGELYVIQARPETVVTRQSKAVLRQYQLGSQRGDIVTRGRAVGTSIATGRARIIHHASELEEFQSGEILVSSITAPDWEPVMKTAAAIVTDSGGRTCHAAIIARELGITAVVGTSDATTSIENGQVLTVNCAEGDQGVVYEGALDWQVVETHIDALVRPKTKIMVNLGNPELAFKTSFIPNDGVGLARTEFIIAEYIKAHPMALLHPQRVSDKHQREALQSLTRAYASPSDYFIQRLSEGVGTIAAAFYPKPVVVRMSDFKSNEYAALLGGADFELDENNPMIGFRGASRYTHPAYAEGFGLECKAMLRVREEMGLTNVILMIPFCRRIVEAKAVLAAMARNGLQRGENGLQVYVMCEIPNNVILIDDFAQLFDGFSIGSNDLTQLTLGVDRDSEIVAFNFEERDPGVKQMIRLAVEGAQRNQRHSGLCGQAPSDYPDMAEFLVELGIDSISLTPDSLISTTRLVLEVERRLGC
ncbi:MAG: phosphoenolpyruvate synthase [Candidatus Reddybacter sp.]